MFKSCCAAALHGYYSPIAAKMGRGREADARFRNERELRSGALYHASRAYNSFVMDPMPAQRFQLHAHRVGIVLAAFTFLLQTRLMRLSLRGS